MARPKKSKVKVLIDYVVPVETLPGIIQYMIDTMGEGTIQTVTKDTITLEVGKPDKPE